MIIEEEVVIEEQIVPRHVEKIKKHVCDSCGKDITTKLQCACNFCKRELCSECRIQTYYPPLTNEDGGDHTYKYCKFCKEVAEKYKEKYSILQKQIEILEDEQYEVLDECEEEWRKKCNETT